jgi:AcrR family transcriptional regulator
MTNSKQRLIEAAARLTRRDCCAMPGLRALAREAGLNHNTFYRHFQDLDALHEAAVQNFTADLQAQLTCIRLDTANFPPDALITTIFDLTERQPDAFILAYRALHGGPSRAQKIMQDFTAALAASLAADLATLSLLPPNPDPARLARLCQAQTAHILTLASRLIEAPPARRDLQAQAGELLAVLLAGVRKTRLLP